MSNIDHPDHYNTTSYECIDVMEEVFGKPETQIFCKLNAFKYLWREGRKNGIEDVRKAAWYLNTYLDLEEGLKSGNADVPGEENEADFSEEDLSSLAENFGTAIKNILGGVGKVLSNYAKMKDPKGRHAAMYETYQKLKEEGYEDEVAFFFATKEDEDEQ